MIAFLAKGWLTRKRHQCFLYVCFGLSAICYLSTLGARHFTDFIGPTPAYQIAGGALQFVSALWFLSLAYAFLGAIRKSDSDIVWPGGIAGRMLLLIGTLTCLIPAIHVLQTKIMFDGLMRVTVVGSALRIDGAISPDLARRVRKLNLDQAKFVSLGDNTGGFVGGALDVLPLFQRARLETVVVDGHCASSCAILALMMPRRLIAPDAALGFHKLQAASGRDSTATAATRVVRRRLLNLGYSSGTVDRLFSTSELSWYSAAEARRLGLANGCWDREQKREVPCS